MTEPIQLPPPDDPLDLAASAVVDGTATDAERALVEGSAEGRARVAAFGAVAAAVGIDPPGQDAAAAEIARGAALGVTAQRQRRQARWLTPVAAVAAAIVVALGIGSLVVNSDDDSTTTAEQFAQPAPTTAAAMSRLQREAAPQVGADAATAGAGVGGGAAASGPPGAIDGGELGPVSDPQVLAERAGAAIDAEAASPGSVPAAGAPTSEVAACDRAARQRGTPLAALRYRATATYAGSPALVLAYDVADGTTPPHVLEVVARSDCRRLTTLRF